MAILLSLITAACYGAADFCGGLAARRARVVQVIALSHLIGLIGVTALAPVLAETFTWRDAALGAVGGIFGGIGVGLLYRRLALGPMSVVAPLTAVTSAATPAAWGVATGETLSAWAWVGVVVALIAIALVSAVSDGSAAPVTTAVVGESLLSGVAFGLFFIMLDATDGATAPWPVAASRLVTTTVLVGGLILAGRKLRPDDVPTGRLIAAVGVFDTTSNITFLYATNAGLLTLVAVVSSLYPVGTVLLARAVLGERMNRAQLWGFLLAMVATGLIAAA